MVADVAGVEAVRRFLVVPCWEQVWAAEAVALAEEDSAAVAVVSAAAELLAAGKLQFNPDQTGLYSERADAI